MKIIAFAMFAMLAAVGCNSDTDRTDPVLCDFSAPSFGKDLIPKDSLWSILTTLALKSLNYNPKDSLIFAITYSPECPISVAHLGDIQKVVKSFESLDATDKVVVSKLPAVVVLSPEPLPQQYDWLRTNLVLDSGFCIAKKLGFSVYPQLRIYRGPNLMFSGRLSNRAIQVGEKSMVSRHSDSSFLLIQWQSNLDKNLKFLPSHVAVGCLIE